MERKQKIIIGIQMLVCAVLGGIAFFAYGYGGLKMARYFILMFALCWLAAVDAKEQIVPNKAILWLVGIRLLLLVTEVFVYRNSGLIKELIMVPIIGMLIGGGVFLVAHLITRNGIGMGDVKLFLTIGFYVGSTVIFPAMVLSLACMAVYGIVMVCRKKLSMKEKVPFVPFVAIGTIITLLMGF